MISCIDDKVVDGPPPEYDVATSNNNNQPPQIKPQLACLSISQFDRIRLIGFSEADVASIHDVARTWWKSGIDSVQSNAGAREIKLKGTPWIPNVMGNDESRLLLLAIVAKLYEMGWLSHASIGFFLRLNQDKNSLFFRKQQGYLPPSSDFICVSFDHLTKLKIVGNVPSDLSDDILAAFATRIASQEVSDRLKIKFIGNAWLANGEDAVSSQFLVLRLLEILEGHGYKVCMSLETQNGHSGYETDSLICCRPRR